jgi:hypothetical protein
VSALRLKVPVLLDRIKTGAFFARVQVMMTNDDSLRKVSMHPFHQLPQGTNLLRRPCVAGFPSRIQSSLIADADRIDWPLCKQKEEKTRRRNGGCKIRFMEMDAFRRCPD